MLGGNVSFALSARGLGGVESSSARDGCPGYCSAFLLSSRNLAYGTTTSRTTTLNQDLPPKGSQFTKDTKYSGTRGRWI